MYLYAPCLGNIYIYDAMLEVIYLDMYVERIMSRNRQNLKAMSQSACSPLVNLLKGGIVERGERPLHQWPRYGYGDAIVWMRFDALPQDSAFADADRLKYRKSDKIFHFDV